MPSISPRERPLLELFSPRGTLPDPEMSLGAAALMHRALRREKGQNENFPSISPREGPLLEL